MHLRFPLPAGYFPKFQLTPSDAQAYYSQATDIVRETRADLAHYVRDGKNYIDSKRWKLAKSKDRLHCYRKRSTKGSADQLGLYGNVAQGREYSMSSAGSDNMDFSQTSSSTRMRPSMSVASSNCSSSTGRSDDEPSRKSIAPMVIGYGVVDGTVDDLVYGLHESSTEEMKTLSSFLGGDESLVDCAVLHTIKLTRASFLGFKWKLSRTVGGNRDCCFLEYVGISVDHNGDRYGYCVMESVDLASCPPFDDNSISRSNLSFCFIFRPGRLPGQVEVFMEGAFDSSADALTAGGVGDYRNAMDMLFTVETALQAAEAKKLSAMVTKQASVKDKPQSSSLCSICRAKAKLLSSHSNCQTCGAVICSKCRLRKATFSRRGKIKIACCKLCLVIVKDQSPFAGEKFERQPLHAIQKRVGGAAPSEAGSVDSLGSDKRLRRIDSSATGVTSFADSDFSSSVLSSAASSSVSSLSYSDLDDNFSDRLHMSSTGPSGNAMVVADRRMMPSVNEYSSQTQQQQQQIMVTYDQQQRMQYEQQQYQQQQFLARQQQRQVGGGVPPTNAAYGRMAPPPPPAHAPMNAADHRAGLYNQMLELQMAAERAYNLANQNANMMHSQPQAASHESSASRRAGAARAVRPRHCLDA